LLGNFLVSSIKDPFDELDDLQNAVKGSKALKFYL
jgi:hypothetical protein